MHQTYSRNFTTIIYIYIYDIYIYYIYIFLHVGGRGVTLDIIDHSPTAPSDAVSGLSENGLSLRETAQVWELEF